MIWFGHSVFWFGYTGFWFFADLYVAKTIKMQFLKPRIGRFSNHGPSKKCQAPPRDEVMDWPYIEWLHVLAALDHMAARPSVNRDHSTVEVIDDGMFMFMPRIRSGETGRAPILYFDNRAYSLLDPRSLSDFGLWSAWLLMPDQVLALRDRSRVTGWETLFTRNSDVPACSLKLPSGVSLSTLFDEFNAVMARPVKRD